MCVCVEGETEPHCDDVWLAVLLSPAAACFPSQKSFFVWLVPHALDWAVPGLAEQCVLVHTDVHCPHDHIIMTSITPPERLHPACDFIFLLALMLVVNDKSWRVWVTVALFSRLTLSFCLSLCGGKASVLCEFVRKAQSQLRLNIGLLTLNCPISVVFAWDFRRFTACLFFFMHYLNSVFCL